MPDRLPYEIVDVFTDRAFAGGNPLAVVLAGEDLETEQMQLLAREFGFSETAFPLRPDGPGHDYRLRIFTPEAELPFAGHPSIGAAWVLAMLRRLPAERPAADRLAADRLAAERPAAGRFVQRTAAGDYALTVTPGEGGEPGFVELDGGRPTIGPELAAERLLAAVALDEGDLAGPVPRLAGTGLAWAFLAVRPDAVARAGGDVARLRAVADLAPAGIYVHAVEGTRVHARGFAGDIGVAEDPATGSAALGLGAYLVATGALPGDGRRSYEVSQGGELGRPSLLHGTVVAAAGTAERVWVGGHVAPVASGRIRLPRIVTRDEFGGRAR